MISFTTSSFPVKRKMIWFANQPSLKLGLFDNYIQSLSKDHKVGFKRMSKYTKLIDIKNDLFSEGFCKQTHKKIRKASEEGIMCKTVTDSAGFIEMFNEFCRCKNFKQRMSEHELGIYGNRHIIRGACTKEGKYLVYHTYLLDITLKRARLLYSVSIIHGEISQQERNLAGFANRRLHYEDMLYLKEMGFKTYDFGGYAYNTTDKSLAGINEFKDSFGGILVEESNYESLIVYWLKEIGSNRFLKKLIR